MTGIGGSGFWVSGGSSDESEALETMTLLPQPRLILASRSPRRRALLRQAGIAHRVCLPRYKEGAPRPPFARFVEQAALAKAQDVAKRIKGEAWILAADTLVVQGSRVFGKPASRQEAQRMLQSLSGQEHQVLTGVSLLCPRPFRRLVWCEKTRVVMRPITSKELAEYLAGDEWQDKAGAYGIQGQAGKWVKKVIGCYFNVVGLPLASVCGQLIQLGFWK